MQPQHQTNLLSSTFNHARDIATRIAIYQLRSAIRKNDSLGTYNARAKLETLRKIHSRFGG